jgi:hypothetical protein
MIERREPLEQGLRFLANGICNGGYGAAVSSKVGASAGVSDEVGFGQHEPALQHCHDTYRESSGKYPLLLIEG